MAAKRQANAAVVGFGSIATAPAPSGEYQDQMFFDSTTGRAYWCDGSSWNLVTDAASKTLSGLAACSMDDTMSASAANVMIGGTVYAILCQIYKPGKAVTQAAYVCTSAGATLTAGENLMAAYTLDGQTQLAVSGDLSQAGTAGNWTATGARNPALAFTLPTDIAFWMLMLSVGTTPPTLRAGGNNVPANMGVAPSGAGARVGTLGTGQTALPATFNPASVSTGSAPLAFCVGVF